MEVIVRRTKFSGVDDGTTVHKINKPDDFQRMYEKDLNDYKPPTNDHITKSEGYYRIVSDENEVIGEICDLEESI